MTGQVKDFKPFDPRLRSAMAEIEQVLEKYNVGGQVDLVSKTHAEYRLFAPKWAPHSKDLKTSEFTWHIRKGQPDANNLICHFIAGCRDLAASSFVRLQKVHEELEKHYELTHHRVPVVRSPEDLGGGEDEGGAG